ncbi:MAG: 30S ribosomal protein S8 [Saprospiraceae bacterium]|nr:30S ribosomal protein S8 [Saprospiraceae bacterium]
MAVTDSIGDYLTRIRNAQSAGHRMVEIPSSNVKKRMTEILYDNGYILKYKFDKKEGEFEKILIALKYDPITRLPIIQRLDRASRPGLRKYSGSEDLPRVNSGLGIAIVSTNKGIMTDKQARAQKIGGEIMCYIF